MFSGLLLVAGAVCLAAEPALWLVGTWYKQGYDGIGWVAFLLAAAIACWSGLSPLETTEHRPALPLALLMLTALIRLVAQILDVNVVGALLLAVDVYALATLAQLQHRRRRVSPLWLALLFCFSLPIEPMLQRMLGYDLQQLSAWLACGILHPVFDDLSCQGVRLRVDGHDVLVDLPCSGAELLSLAGLALTVIHAMRAPRFASALAGTLLCVLVAVVANALRIAVLALGIVFDDALAFSVMDPLPHTVIGVVFVALTCAVLLFFVTNQPNYPPAPVRQPRNAALSASMPGTGRGRAIVSVLFLPLALMIGALQPQPADASPPLSPPEVPLAAAGFLRTNHALTSQEERYFTQFGGGAQRASFGPFGLLLVTTASPLRHLHDPTVCLSGMGYAVSLLGTDHDSGTTLYRAVSTSPVHTDVEAQYMVRVSYVSEAGERASSIAEAVWRWLRKPQSKWTMVQRIVPMGVGIDPDLAGEFDSAMRRAFNLT